MKKFFKKLTSCICTYRVVINSGKHTDDKGGMYQKRWLTIGPFGLWINFENMHNPERRIENEMINTWKKLKKLRVDRDDAIEKRRSKVLGAGTSIDGINIKGNPFKESGQMFEFKRFKIDLPSKTELDEVLSALNRFGRGVVGNITGRTENKKDVLKALKDLGKRSTAVSEASAGYISVEGDAENLQKVDTDKVINESENPPNQNKQKGQQNQPQNRRRGYVEPG